MITEVKLTRQLYQRLREDLVRYHPFAYERVGFISTRLGSLDKGRCLIASSYWPVPDEQCIDDPEVGARINAQAIRTAMQRIIDTGEGVMHVHAHDHKGRPSLGITDRKELPPIIRSFQIVGPHALHGALVISEDSAAAFIWLTHSLDPIAASKISIVGYPLTFYR